MILVCAPTRVEARACRRGIADARAASLEVLRTGVGPARAAAALEARLALEPRPALVVSSGFAGALTPGIPLHATITATSLHRLGPDGALPIALATSGLVLAAGALPCRFASGERVLIGGSSRLPAPAALDMESAALAETAAAAGIPVSVVRVVTDTPSAPFPQLATAIGDALAARSRSVRLTAGVRAALGALRHPLEALTFARSSLAAARALRTYWSARARDAVEAERDGAGDGRGGDTADARGAGDAGRAGGAGGASDGRGAARADAGTSRLDGGRPERPRAEE